MYYVRGYGLEKLLTLLSGYGTIRGIIKRRSDRCANKDSGFVTC